MHSAPPGSRPDALERFVDVPRHALFTRTVGDGEPIVVVHGGPGTLDHTYLLPTMDRLANLGRLTYVDQRGHGRSHGELEPGDVTAERFVDDLARVLDALELDAPTVLGHSWGGHLALRFALTHADRVRRLVLMNSGPASKADHDAFVAFRRRRGGVLVEEQGTLQASAAYADADPLLVADLVRRTFSIGVHRPTDVARIHLRFTREDVLRGRMIAERFESTLFSRPFDLLAELAGVHVPTLMLHGEHDFVPVETVAPIAEALPDADLVVIPACGHFAYLEAEAAVHAAVGSFLRG